MFSCTLRHRSLKGGVAFFFKALTLTINLLYCSAYCCPSSGDECTHITDIELLKIHRDTADQRLSSTRQIPQNGNCKMIRSGRALLTNCNLLTTLFDIGFIPLIEGA